MTTNLEYLGRGIEFLHIYKCFFYSLCDIEENTTKLKKIKVDNEVLDLDCEWEDCSVNLASVRVSGYAP